jgi:ribosome maturation factor RimP
MQIAEEVKKWSEAFLPEGVFVVNVEHKPGGGKLSVYIDADGPLNILQCRQLNRHLSEKLDEVDFGSQPYTLEVSSPGIDKPLQLQRQYRKHIGRELKVKLKSKTELEGRLQSMDEEKIVLLLKDKKKGYKAKEQTEKEIAFDEIEEAVVQVSFK